MSLLDFKIKEFYKLKKIEVVATANTQRSYFWGFILSCQHQSMRASATTTTTTTTMTNVN